MAASTAANWIMRCAGVQKVSRPMVSCQEMSQYKPTGIHKAPRAHAQTYQGIPLLGESLNAANPADRPVAMVFMWITQHHNRVETLQWCNHRFIQGNRI